MTHPWRRFLPTPQGLKFLFSLEPEWRANEADLQVVYNVSADCPWKRITSCLAAPGSPGLLFSVSCKWLSHISKSILKWSEVTWVNKRMQDLKHHWAASAHVPPRCHSDCAGQMSCGRWGYKRLPFKVRYHHYHRHEFIILILISENLKFNLWSRLGNFGTMSTRLRQTRLLQLFFKESRHLLVNTGIDAKRSWKTEIPKHSRM